MTAHEARKAVPPAYSEWIGQQWLTYNVPAVAAWLLPVRDL
ncbi:hypothetical protein [Streptomyces sp. NPDC057702]